jgi:hypothetical protein
MPMAKVDEALALVRANPQNCHFVGPRSDELIEAAEQALGFRLPPLYRRFVSELGAGTAGSESIYGVINLDFVSSSAPNAIWLTLKHRESSNLPTSMIVASDDGMGGYFVLDTAKAPPGGEPPVEVWEPGMSQPGDKFEFIAPDFGTWFLDTVKFGLDLE